VHREKITALIRLVFGLALISVFSFAPAASAQSDDPNARLKELEAKEAALFRELHSANEPGEGKLPEKQQQAEGKAAQPKTERSPHAIVSVKDEQKG